MQFTKTSSYEWHKTLWNSFFKMSSCHRKRRFDKNSYDLFNLYWQNVGEQLKQNTNLTGKKYNKDDNVHNPSTFATLDDPCPI